MAVIFSPLHQSGHICWVTAFSGQLLASHMKTHPILIKQAQLGGSTFVCVTFIRSQKSGTRRLYSQFWGWKSGCGDGGAGWRVVAPPLHHPPWVPDSQPPDSSRTSNTSTPASPSLPHPYYIFTVPQSPLSFGSEGGGSGRERKKRKPIW